MSENQLNVKKHRALPYTNCVLNWVQLGMDYGYPSCCIGEFVIHFIKNTTETRSDRKLRGTGYVPCIKCNELSEDELIYRINALRSNPKPFIRHKKAA